MSEGGATLIWCPFPTYDAACEAANCLVEEGLVACANILPQMTAIFAWEGRVDKAEEVGALFKTDARQLDAAIARLEVLHPYELPAIMAWGAEGTAPATACWLASLVRGANAT